jgi:hypothetical protein
MGPSEESEILRELMKMDPTIEDADLDEQYRRCFEVWNKLSDWRAYALVELVDAVTFESKWFWRRKS